MFLSLISSLALQYCEIFFLQIVSMVALAQAGTDQKFFINNDTKFRRVNLEGFNEK